MIVNGITLWEPWASLMRAGEKRNETRSWGTCHLGPLLICAAKTKKGVNAIAGDPSLDKSLTEVLGDTNGAPWSSRPIWNFGQAVALVNVKRVVRTDHFATPAAWDNLPMNEAFFGDYTRGRYIWMTQPIDLDFTPFPVKGRQGLFRIALDVDQGPDGIKVLGPSTAGQGAT